MTNTSRSLSEPYPTRVLLLGCGGAGKSTLAVQLGEILDLQVVHLDSHYWQAGWVEPDKPEWRANVKEMAAEQTWIMDGNYGDTIEYRLPRAEAEVFLDFPRWLCLWRIVKRYLMYRKGRRPDMAPGCDEQIDRVFLKWIWGYPVTHRPKVYRMLDALPDEVQRVVLSGPRDVDSFLRDLATPGR